MNGARNNMFKVLMQFIKDEIDIIKWEWHNSQYKLLGVAMTFFYTLLIFTIVITIIRAVIH